MEHSSKCDILGISTGNDLNALLPIELAHSADSELEDLFVYNTLLAAPDLRYNRNHAACPAHRNQACPSQRSDDCLSGHLGKHGWQAGEDCPLPADKAPGDSRPSTAELLSIAFSVSIHPIDVRKERARLLEFFSKTACGDTDATRMLEATFRLLKEGKEYYECRCALGQRFQDSSLFTCLYGGDSPLSGSRYTFLRSADWHHGQ